MENTENKAKILSGKEKDFFINFAEQSDVFKKVTEDAKIDMSSLVQNAKMTNNDLYSELVIISGVEKWNNLNQFQVFIEPKTEKVVRVITMSVTGDEPNDTFTYYDYDGSAELQVEASGKVEDMENGNVEFFEKVESADKITTQAVPDKYIYWACRFSGFWHVNLHP